MKTYLFTLFSRAFLVFSGFLVFLLSSYLYGPSGRGAIGYATSVYATLGSIISFNLGRGFLAETLKNEIKKKELLGIFIFLNFIFGFVASLLGMIYIFYTDTGRSMLTPMQTYLFALTSFFYIWSANGNYFFSSFLKTSLQDLVIIIVRFILILVLALLAYLKDREFNHFVLSYCIVLTIGVCIENYVLIRHTNTRLVFKPDFKAMTSIIKKSIAHHIDFLSFHIFPSLLTILSASYITKSEVGKINFTLQLTNLIYLFSVTANIKISAYVTELKFRDIIARYRKLALFTILSSFIGAVIIYFALGQANSIGWLAQFEGVQKLFLFSTLSIPAFMIYQFLGPIWIELKKQNTTALLLSSNFIICMIIANYLIKEYNTIGVMYAYAVFGCGVIIIQLCLFFIEFGFFNKQRLIQLLIRS